MRRVGYSCVAKVTIPLKSCVPRVLKLASNIQNKSKIRFYKYQRDSSINKKYIALFRVFLDHPSYRHVVCSSITILKHPPIYQNNHSQVLVILSVKITIMNKFYNKILFCIAHDIPNHSSAIILIYRFKHVTDNFRYWHTPML